VCLAIPGRVVDMLDEQRSISCVEVAGVRRGVDVGLLASERDRVRAGDWVLVHVGFAISRIDELEARATLRLLQAMGAEYEQELAELRASVA
jgi:hydrogenase expression/formation protein HypC